MPTLRNVSPYGDLDVPLLRRVVAAGEKFECTTEEGKILARQAENFEVVKAPARKPAKKAAPAATPTSDKAAD